MSPTEEKGISELYRSIVDYHNNLVNIRFTVAILFFTGSAFLVSSVFSSSSCSGIKFVPGLGLALTTFVIILEIRTMFLLKNIGALGGQVEEKLLATVDTFKVNCNGKIKGFFSLMENQPIQPPIPFAKHITHTKGLFLIYISFFVFWIVLLVTEK